MCDPTICAHSAAPAGQSRLTLQANTLHSSGFACCIAPRCMQRIWCWRSRPCGGAPPTGFCVAYLIFIKANISSLAPIPGDLSICITLVPLILLAQLRGVAALATFSLIADAAMISGAPSPRFSQWSCTIFTG